MSVSSVLLFGLIVIAALYVTFGVGGSAPGKSRAHKGMRHYSTTIPPQVIAAWHEAGHARFWHKRRGKLGDVLIDKRGAGGATYLEHRWFFGPDLRDRETDALVSLAGSHVEADLAGVTTREALDTQAPFSPSDHEDFTAATGSRRKGKYQRRVDYYSKRLDRMGINSQDPAIRALAERLLEKGKVSGDEATRIMDKHSGWCE